MVMALMERMSTNIMKFLEKDRHKPKSNSWEGKTDWKWGDRGPTAPCPAGGTCKGLRGERWKLRELLVRTWPWRKEQQLHGSRRAKPCDHASVGTALQSIWPVAASQEGAGGADKAQSLLLGRGGGTGRNYLHFRATSANGLSFGTDARREEQHRTCKAWRTPPAAPAARAVEPPAEPPLRCRSKESRSSSAERRRRG